MRGIDVSKYAVTPPVSPGAAPMLQWLKISDLVIDDHYQRDINKTGWRSIEVIAKNFSWAKFSPVFVAPVAGGRYAIIDGQHRAHAAAICGFEEVPCQIVQMSACEQASAFAAINGNVVKITVWNVFKAALAAGEPWAVEASMVCADAGCRLMTYNASTETRRPRDIFAITTIREMIARYGAQIVQVALAAYASNESADDVERWQTGLIKAWIMAIGDRPYLANRCDLAAFLDDFDILSACDSVEKFQRDRRRQGIATPSRCDLISAEIGTALDRAYPPRGRIAAE